MEFWFHVGNLVAIYLVLTLSLNLLVGYAGLFSVTQGGVYGIGAYAFALASLRLGSPYPLTVLIALLVPAVFGAVIALPSLRLSGDYLVIASLGLQTVIVAVLMNLDSITGGAVGLAGIPPPQLGAWMGIDPISYLPLSLGLAILVTAAMLALVHSPYGRALKMIRDDELAAAAAGKNIVALKVSAFAIGSAMAGLAGALYAGYVTYIDPTSFTVTVSIYVLSLVIVGGSATVIGSIVGATTVVAMSEALRFLPFPSAFVGEARQALYGLLLVGFVIWRPEGLFGESSRRRATTSAEVPLSAEATIKVAPSAGSNGESADRKPDLECREVVAGYDNLMVLRGVSLVAKTGEIVVVAGHNGAGKSTLLRAIAGTSTVRRGTVLVRGEDVTNRQGDLVGEDRVGLVPQTGGVFPAMTVAENLKVAGYTLRHHPKHLRERVDSVIELFPRLGVLLQQPARQLSGGQQRMLSLAMALVPGYRLLLLDEPSIGLSPVMVESTLETIHDITRTLGITAVLCEQNVRPALEVADRAYVLKAGQVALEAKASDLLKDRDLWRLF